MKSHIFLSLTMTFILPRFREQKLAIQPDQGF